MQRYLLLHEGQRILLPEGDTVIGRGLRCRIRFNDPAISREHLRIVVHAGRATVVNLSSTGTLINGRRLGNPRQLQDGDLLRLGYRTVKVAVVQDAPDPSVAQRRAAHEDLLLAESVDEENTRPGEDGWRKRLHGGDPSAGQAPSPGQVCPSCRSKVPLDEATCAACGYRWPTGPTSRVTLDIPIEDLRPRQEARYRIEVPVLYASATQTFHAIGRDISRGGMFIATDMRDAIGTPCELTALPDGYPAMTFSGVVAHVADRPSASRAAGLGVRLVGGSDEAVRWLEGVLARFSEAIVED